MGRQAKHRAAGNSNLVALRRLHYPSRIGLAVAAAVAGAALPHRAPAAEASDSSGGLQEVIVTARKVAENLQDVPISVDVLSRKELQNLAISSFDDYAQKMPSISYISLGPGAQLFVLRGVSDGSNPNYSNTSSPRPLAHFRSRRGRDTQHNAPEKAAAQMDRVRCQVSLHPRSSAAPT